MGELDGARHPPMVVELGIEVHGLLVLPLTGSTPLATGTEAKPDRKIMTRSRSTWQSQLGPSTVQSVDATETILSERRYDRLNPPT
ncbi:hypothetical protein, partial [Frankia sp. Cas3]|uniref:hypothetical protein n=1 Tax=Frankia sp. Cas3 TaxID=3073926 RepID=UPI002AD20CE5